MDISLTAAALTALACVFTGTRVAAQVKPHVHVNLVHRHGHDGRTAHRGSVALLGIGILLVALVAGLIVLTLARPLGGKAALTVIPATIVAAGGVACAHGALRVVLLLTALAVLVVPTLVLS